jgi:hypothetical protein
MALRFTAGHPCWGVKVPDGPVVVGVVVLGTGVGFTHARGSSGPAVQRSSGPAVQRGNAGFGRAIIAGTTEILRQASCCIMTKSI